MQLHTFINAYTSPRGLGFLSESNRDFQIHGISSFLALLVPGWNMLKIACDLVIPDSVQESERWLYFIQRNPLQDCVSSLLCSIGA